VLPLACPPYVSPDLPAIACSDLVPSLCPPPPACRRRMLRPVCPTCALPGLPVVVCSTRVPSLHVIQPVHRRVFRPGCCCRSAASSVRMACSLGPAWWRGSTAPHRRGPCPCPPPRSWRTRRGEPGVELLLVHVGKVFDRMSLTVSLTREPHLVCY
jgi:hypothetical protein